MARGGRWAGVALVLVLGGCTPFAFSPPTRTLPLESAETAGLERTGVSVQGGTHFPQIGALTARMRHGLGADVDLQLEGGWAYYPVGEHVGQGRVGIKHRIHPFVAWTGGLGGGYGRWGMFGGPDLGAIVAFENPTLVPFLGLRMSASLPIVVVPETVRTGSGTTVISPPPCLYFQPSLGLRLPLCGSCDGVRVDASVAGSYTELVLIDGQGPFDVWGIEGGIEVVLGRSPPEPEPEPEPEPQAPRAPGAAGLDPP